jgi:phenylalanyl-tRNA synthetase beta chain
VIPTQKTRQAFGIKTEMAVGYVDLLLVKSLSTSQIVYAPISRFQQVVRDVNLVFEKKVTAEEISAVLSRIKADNLKSGFIKDIYEGGGLSENQKSVTIRMVLGASDRTLTEDEIKATENQLVSMYSKTLGGSLRA